MEHIDSRPLHSLGRWDRNYRVGDVQAILNSIVRFGFNGALKVWRDGQVMAGNHALIALETIQANGGRAPRGILVRDGVWLVPCIDVSHLNRTEAQAYAIADNYTAELGRSDPETLAVLLAEIKEEDPGLVEATGFSDEALAALLAEVRSLGGEPAEDEGAVDPNAPDFGEIRPELGEIWQLGPHRICCGDAREPLALVEEAISNSSRSGERVCDPCLGSGTTLAASERLGRICYGFELCPRYCEATFRRWEALTGGTAVRLANGEQTETSTISSERATSLG